MGTANLHSTLHNDADSTIEALQDVVGYVGDSSITLIGEMSKRPTALFDHYTNVGNTTTSETDLVTYTAPANRLATNGEKIDAEYGGVFVSSATATRKIKVYFAGSVLLDTGALTLSLSASWCVYVTLIRASSSVLRYMVSLTTEGAALAAYTSVGELTSQDFTTTNVLKITGTAAGIGAATNDVVAKVGSGQWRPAA